MPRKKSKKRVRRRSRRSTKKSKGTSNKLMIALKKLKRMRPHHQREAVKMSNDAFIRQLCTHVKKMRHVSVPATLKKRLHRQRKNLQKFVRSKTSTSVKRKMLTQRGGFLPLLIAALPAVGAMVGNIISGVSRRRRSED